MLCTSGFVDDVMFPHNGPYDSIYVSTVLKQVYSKLPTYFPGGATLFDSVAVHNDSKLYTWAKSAVHNCIVL